jgi:hypothetical protein
MFGLMLCALLLVGALSGVALAVPLEGAPEPPQSTSTVADRDFQTGYWSLCPQVPVSSLPRSQTSLEYSAGGEEREIERSGYCQAPPLCSFLLRWRRRPIRQG